MLCYLSRTYHNDINLSTIVMPLGRRTEKLVSGASFYSNTNKLRKVIFSLSICAEKCLLVCCAQTGVKLVPSSFAREQNSTLVYVYAWRTKQPPIHPQQIVPSQQLDAVGHDQTI